MVGIKDKNCSLNFIEKNDEVTRKIQENYDKST